jgi:hypothetical protein
VEIAKTQGLRPKPNKHKKDNRKKENGGNNSTMGFKPVPFLSGAQAFANCDTGAWMIY